MNFIDLLSGAGGLSKGFIKAEVYHSEAKLKQAGKFRIEVKEYIAKDGDVKLTE